MVQAADSTLAAIKRKVRRLTASPSEAQLTDALIEEYINDFYTLDLPHLVKVNELREVFEFYTSSGVDRYTFTAAQLNGNLYYHQPLYIDGYRGTWFQDRTQFYAKWPKISVEVDEGNGDGTPGPYAFTIDAVPLLRNEVFISAVDANGDVQVARDDGSGNLVRSDTGATIGSINYTTGAVAALTFPQAIPTTSDINSKSVQLELGRPRDAMFFRDYIEVRPVPDGVYKVTFEVYQTPTDFIATNADPRLRQWWEYIAYGASKKVLEDRQDMQGVAALIPEMQRQEGLILERTALEDSDLRAATIYTGSAADGGYGGFY